jgi:tetratricopeptide (TPR) repeat protein
MTRTIWALIIGAALVGFGLLPAELASQSGQGDTAAIIQQGEELISQSNYEDAVSQFQKVLSSDPHNSYALFRMGEARFKLGNLRAAMNALNAAAHGDLRPKWIEVWSYINTGRFYDIRGKREQAVTAYHKAIDTGDDAFGAQAEAKKYLSEPFKGRAVTWPSE